MSDLTRFHEAQKDSYETALAEMKRGRKSSHWMWYIFPQLKGLGRSGMAEYYGISCIQEARDYLNDPVLRERLIQISQAVLQADSDDAAVVMGVPDNMKLRSCMTLFREADPSISVFSAVLDKFFRGEVDRRTLDLLAGQKGL